MRPDQVFVLIGLAVAIAGLIALVFVAYMLLRSWEEGRCGRHIPSTARAHRLRATAHAFDQDQGPL